MTHKKQFATWLLHAVKEDLKLFALKSPDEMPYKWSFTLFNRDNSQRINIYRFNDNLINLEWGDMFRPRFKKSFRSQDNAENEKKLLQCIEDVINNVEPHTSDWITEDYCRDFMQSKKLYAYGLY